MQKTDAGFIRKVVAGSNSIVAYTEEGGTIESFTLDLLQPYFVICEGSGFLKITDIDAKTVAEAEAGNIGYVPSAQVYDWPTREALSFSDLAFLSGRPEIVAWDSREGIEGFLKTGDDRANPPTFRENMDATLLRDRETRPYPVLGSTQGMVRGTTPKRVYDVLLPTAIQPSDAVVLDTVDAAAVTSTLTSATIVVAFDATGSMDSFALGVAAAINAALDTLPDDVRTNTRIGFVFYRDETDPERLVPIPPMALSDAATFLEQSARLMAGGGDDAEPVLDAVYYAANLYDWPADAGRKLIVAVLGDDAKPATIGTLESQGRIPPGLDATAVAHSLFEANIPVLSVQAGPKDGPNLRPVLSTLGEATGGAFLPFGDGLKVEDVAGAMARAMGDRTRAEIASGTAAAGKMFDFNGYPAIPLEVLDGEKLERLRAAGIDYNINRGDGGVLVTPGYMLENADLLSPQFQIDKDTLLDLINVYSVLSVTGVDAAALRTSAGRAIAAIAGEGFDPDEAIKDVLGKQLGIQFRSELLNFNLDYLDALTPAERLAFSKRIQDAATALNQYLEANLEAFDTRPSVWMPIAALP